MRTFGITGRWPRLPFYPQRSPMKQFCQLFFILSALVLAFHYLFPQLQRMRLRQDLSWYDLGLYGFSPSQSYVSFKYRPPVIETVKWSDRCDRGYTFLAPRGDSILNPGPMILDSNGQLVWMMHSPNVVQDFKVQEYLGEKYLTYWEGNEVDGHGNGSWKMLDSSYTQRFAVSPARSVEGDLHDFQVTANGTALVTAYDAIPADLTLIGGPAAGWIYDGVLQEIDIATGRLVFEWRSSEHFPINSTYLELMGLGRDRQSAFDYFHLNSVAKDPNGNYLISARHTHTVSTIDGTTGSVLWTIGGKMNEFRDISNGHAISFAWQHDARWHDNKTLTIFDNAAHANSDPAIQSRGLAIELDVPARTAYLRSEYTHPQEMKSLSQGNLQVLEDSGNVLVGWGHSAAYTEFTHQGEALCDVHFGASAFFTFGRAVSYRALKGSWVGKPSTGPDARLHGNSIYVSWNGATNVALWDLEAATERGLSEDSIEFLSVDNFAKTGFETRLDIPRHVARSLFRVKALDYNGEVLGNTSILQQESWWNLERLLVGIIMFSIIICLVGLYCTVQRIFRKFGLPKPQYLPTLSRHE